MDPITITAVTPASVAHARACFTDPAAITRWNFASEDWHCPEAENDLRPGGAFRYRMAARDGSMSFDYAGTWEVVEAARLVQVLGDGRRVEVVFEADACGTRITENFDPDDTAPRQMQEAGWQAILNQFAAFCGTPGDIRLEQVEPRHLVGVRRRLPVSELGPFFAEALPKVMGWLAQQGIAPASMPMAVWWAMDMDSGIADCQAGCFVAEAVEGEGDITAGVTACGDVLTVVHKGPYDSVGQSWMAVYKKAAELGRAPGSGWEIYVDDPGTTAPEELRTQIFLPMN